MSRDTRKEFEAEADKIGQEVAFDLKRRLMLWAVRWTIGFIAIALLVNLYPGAVWLWYVGIGVAALSLTVLLVIEKMVRERLELTHEYTDKVAKEAE